MMPTSMPAPGYRRPESFDATGLTVTVIHPGGEQIGPFSFADTGATELVARQVTAAFDRCSQPDGPWQSKSSLRTAHSASLHFLRLLQPLDIDITTLSEFTPEYWWKYKADRETKNRWPGQINIMRVLLRAAPDVPSLTKKTIAQRTHKPDRRLYDAYSAAEFSRIQAAARADFHAAHQRLTSNVAFLNSYLAGGDPGPSVQWRGTSWSKGEMLRELSAEGRLTVGPRSPELRQMSKVLGTMPGHPSHALFLTRQELTSAMVLLVCSRGYNVGTLPAIEVPEQADAEGQVLIAHFDKPRRGAARHFTHSYSGADARMLRRIIEATEPARACMAGLGHPTRQLLIAGAWSGSTTDATQIFVTKGFTNAYTSRKWVQALGVTADDGEPLRLHFPRLRLTEQVLNRHASQNTDRVSHDLYRRHDPLTIAGSEEVILAGQQDAIDHAAAQLQLRYGATPADLGLPARTAHQVAEHVLDTAVGACTDFHHSPFGEDEKPCPASFLLCLACPNAVATPDHVPRLLVLQRALENMASASPEHFERHHADHAQRLRHLLSNIPSPIKHEARAKVTDRDENVIERLLRKELDA